MNIASALLLLILAVIAAVVYPQVLIAGKVIFILLLSIAMIFVSSYIAGQVWDKIEAWCVLKMDWKPNENIAQIVRMIIIGSLSIAYVTGMHKICG